MFIWAQSERWKPQPEIDFCVRLSVFILAIDCLCFINLSCFRIWFVKFRFFRIKKNNKNYSFLQTAFIEFPGTSGIRSRRRHRSNESRPSWPAGGWPAGGQNRVPSAGGFLWPGGNAGGLSVQPAGFLHCCRTRAVPVLHACLAEAVLDCWGGEICWKILLESINASIFSNCRERRKWCKLNHGFCVRELLHKLTIQTWKFG